MKKIFFTSFFLLTTILLSAQEIRSVKITEVEKIIASSTKPMIINMWATWCKPCLEEIPYFLEEVRERNEKGDSIEFLLVSLDFKEAFPEEIKAFAVKKQLTAPIVWLDETNADYFCPRIDAKWSGALPATLFFNNKNRYRNFIEGKIKHEDLKTELKLLSGK